MPTAIHYYSSDEYEESETESVDNSDASSSDDAKNLSVHQEHITPGVPVAKRLNDNNAPITHEEESEEIDNTNSNKTSNKYPNTNQRKHRRSRRIGTVPLLRELASHIVSSKPIVFITGAGLSAASGIQTFRGPDGLWSEVIWKNATREEFRKNPLNWYNEFWVSISFNHTCVYFVSSTNRRCHVSTCLYVHCCSVLLCFSF